MEGGLSFSGFFFKRFRFRRRLLDAVLGLVLTVSAFALRQAALPAMPLLSAYPFFPSFFVPIWIAYRRGFIAGTLATGFTDLSVYREFVDLHGMTEWRPLVVFSFISISINWLVTQLKSARIQEQELRVSQAHFIAMLGHELKSPLATIKMAGEFLAGEKPAREIQARLSQLNHAIDDIVSIVDRCILLEQIDHGNLTIAHKLFDPTHLAAEVIEASGNGERVMLCSQEAFQIQSDPVLLKWALVNLVENALKYSPPQTSVRVDIEPVSGRRSGCRISVRNKIHAGSKETFSRVFEKFYRGVHSPAISGSGLGLWLVKCIMEQLSGEVQCRTDADAVIFTLWLPETSK